MELGHHVSEGADRKELEDTKPEEPLEESRDLLTEHDESTGDSIKEKPETKRTVLDEETAEKYADKGADRYDRRIVGQGEPTVFDKVTGLEWQGCAKGIKGNECEAGSSEMMNLQNALEYCSNLSWGGHDDWRLPVREDLATIVIERGIVRDQELKPAINPEVFPKTPRGFLGTSTTGDPRTGNPRTGWYIDFSYGDISRDSPMALRRARCVRQTRID